ncbi:MAG: N-6 DNA methylase [Chloroflexota bacterium]|nr:N-6 DNA methylase [Chloroflexota bacterium]MDE2908593.1 N-6 DNA methylase [Chloroflexota bacterium]
MQASEETRKARLGDYIRDTKSFMQNWEYETSADPDVTKALSRASKNKTRKPGKPDLIYVNHNDQLLILVEVKPQVRQHQSAEENNPVHFAVDGIKHYLKFFTNRKLKLTDRGLPQVFDNWAIFGVAFSGNIEAETEHRITTYTIEQNETIADVGIGEILNEEDYLNLSKGFEIERLATIIDSTSRDLNESLRSLDSQKRPVLLSALMICLFPQKTESADFRNNYRRFNDGNTLVANMLTTVQKVLESENIPRDKVDVLLNELAFCRTDHILQTSTLLKDLLKKLEEIIPHILQESAYDILGKFYHDFLKYAGITNVKNGIVLTPPHICELFAELVEFKTNDVILDPACGTGSFLLSGMRKVTKKINESDLSNKLTRISNLKTKQLIGFETNSTMYSLSISNMLFKGDGKSNIYNENFFSDNADIILQEIRPSIGFVNPPYGGEDNNAKPTKKEIQFLERMLDKCSRYGIIIAPWSTFIGENNSRRRILTKHTLLYSINMPVNLFQPNAAACTTICVFETNRPHPREHLTKFYDLVDDGFVLTKTKGRADIFNRWSALIKPALLSSIRNECQAQTAQKGQLIYSKVYGGREWIIQDHIEADYSGLRRTDFESVVKEYAVFIARLKSDMVGDAMNDIQWVDLVTNYLSIESLSDAQVEDFDAREWQEYSLCDRNDGMRLFSVKGAEFKFTKRDIHRMGSGNCLYVTTSNKNNGVSGTCNFEQAESNVITVDSATDGKTFYQQFSFVGSDHVEVLHPELGTRLNAFTGLFIVTLLNFRLTHYGYGRKRAQKRLRNEKVLLPSLAGKPDWDYMELFIKSLPYSSCIE